MENNKSGLEARLEAHSSPPVQSIKTNPLSLSVSICLCPSIVCLSTVHLFIVYLSSPCLSTHSLSLSVYLISIHMSRSISILTPSDLYNVIVIVINNILVE